MTLMNTIYDMQSSYQRSQENIKSTKRYCCKNNTMKIEQSFFNGEKNK